MPFIYFAERNQIELNFNTLQGYIKNIAKSTDLSGNQAMQISDRIFASLGMTKSRLYDISHLMYECQSGRMAVPMVYMRSFRRIFTGWYESLGYLDSKIDYARVITVCKTVVIEF